MCLSKLISEYGVCEYMSIWFVSRHPGAVEWAKEKGILVDNWVPHLDVKLVSFSDTVIGTLPVHLAFEVCARGANYINLSLDLYFESRGRELTVLELKKANARLEPFHILRNRKLEN